MKGRDLLKIIFCFLLFQTVTGSNPLMADSNDQSMSESQIVDESLQNKRGPGLKVKTIQGKSYKIIERLPDEEIQKREKEIEDFLQTKNMQGEASQIDEDKIREDFRLEGKSEKEIDYIIKKFFRGETDPDEDKEMPEALKAETDQELHALWNKMRTALANNDIDTVMSCFTDKSQKTYRPIFIKLPLEKLCQMADDLKDLQLIKFHSATYAEYDVQNVSNGEQVSWMVVFIKSPWENEWKIKSF